VRAALARNDVRPGCNNRSLVGIHIDREELAWGAGFFDGEGCFCYSEAGQYVCVSIAQSERAPLDRFANAVGLGKVNGPYRQRHNDRWSRKPQYVFRANGHDAIQAIAAMLWFKLGPTKREQAVTVLKRSRTCRRGHLKIKGQKGCGVCQTAYWRSRREAREATIGDRRNPRPDVWRSL
jgi:hypothetical protein